MKKLLTAATILLCMAAMTACSTTSSESFDPAKNDAWAENIVAEQMPGDLSGITPYGRFQRYTLYCDSRFAQQVKKGLHNRLFAA